MFCNFCGNELQNSAVVCPVCGTYAGEDSPRGGAVTPVVGCACSAYRVYNAPGGAEPKAPPFVEIAAEPAPNKRGKTVSASFFKHTR